jgi:hypothetical protein
LSVARFNSGILIVPVGVGRDSDSKLVISIELIQRSLALSVYNFDVEPIASCAGMTVVLRNNCRNG